MKQSHIIIGGAIVLLIGFIGYGIWSSAQPGAYDDFAQCLAEEDATFYGAFWCPHCQDQKDMFGNSEKLLPYVECSLPSGQGRTQVCIEENIESYPTWEFADGERMTGVLSFRELSEQTGCVLPE